MADWLPEPHPVMDYEHEYYTTLATGHIQPGWRDYEQILILSDERRQGRLWLRL